MQPEVEGIAPDPVTDDGAYQSLREQSMEMASRLRRIESEREEIRRQQREEAERQRQAAHAAALVEKYPNPVPDQIYDLACDWAFRREWDDEPEDKAIEETYKTLVDLTRAATAVYAQGEYAS